MDVAHNTEGKRCHFLSGASFDLLSQTSGSSPRGYRQIVSTPYLLQVCLNPLIAQSIYYLFSSDIYYQSSYIVMPQSENAPAHLTVRYLCIEVYIF